MKQILAKQMSGQVQPMSSSEVIGVIMKITVFLIQSQTMRFLEVKWYVLGIVGKERL